MTHTFLLVQLPQSLLKRSDSTLNILGAYFLLKFQAIKICCFAAYEYVAF